MKKLFKFIAFCLLTAIGVYVGLQIAQCRRPVDTSRMEECLRFYKIYRADEDQEKLASNLSTIALTPNDFQHIIDRFILYRTQKSSLEQSMKLLKASSISSLYSILLILLSLYEKVYSISGMEAEPFRLDAEILAVFESKPELVKDAFEG